MTGAGGLTWFNHLDRAGAEAALHGCCAARSWAGKVAAARPYATATALLETADAAVDALGRDGLTEALDAHPRIGERAAGSGRDTAWSRREQAAASDAGAGVRDALATGNREYERRFGHVFLICATGRGAEEILANLRSRLGNDPDAEWDVVREELRAITALRLRKLLAEHELSVPQAAIAGPDTDKTVTP